MQQNCQLEMHFHCSSQTSAIKIQIIYGSISISTSLITMCPYCGNRKFNHHFSVEKLYPFRWLCWKRTGRAGMPQQNELYLINFMNELCAPHGGISTQWPMDRIQHATIFVWFWPHEIWLQSKSRNETTSANRQEIQGLDLVVPQRIDAFCSILCFAFVFKWMLRI